jgi:hypothetical protein
MEVPKMQQICNAIENAVKASVRAIQLPGIADAELRSAALSSQQVRRVADQLRSAVWRRGFGATPACGPLRR